MTVRMKFFGFLHEIVLIIFLVAPLIYLVVFWEKVPEDIPIHWSISGNADNWGHKSFIFILTLPLYLIFLTVNPVIMSKNSTRITAIWFIVKLIGVILISFPLYQIILNLEV